jgi:hypothetical protein
MCIHVLHSLNQICCKILFGKYLVVSGEMKNEFQTWQKDGELLSLYRACLVRLFSEELF